MSKRKSISNLFDEIAELPDKAAMGIRMDLAAIILRKLESKGWTQSKLAEVADLFNSQISSIVNGDSNWQISTAGAILSALGVKARLVEESEEANRDPYGEKEIAQVPAVYGKAILVGDTSCEVGRRIGTKQRKARGDLFDRSEREVHMGGHDGYSRDAEEGFGDVEVLDASTWIRGSRSGSRSPSGDYGLVAQDC